MGNIEIQEDKGLKLLTVNFSNLVNSPFEFYDEQNYEEATGIDSVFQNVLKDELKLSEIELKNYQWDVGSFDKLFQRKRYSVLYNPEACT
jgi:ABC-type oligopeptide transport system substrate-binding subunit